MPSLLTNGKNTGIMQALLLKLKEYRSKVPTSFIWLGLFILGIVWLLTLSKLSVDHLTVMSRFQGGIGLSLFFISGFHLSRYIVFGTYSRGIDQLLVRVTKFAVVISVFAGLVFFFQTLMELSWSSAYGIIIASVCFAMNYILLSSCYQLFRRLSSIKSRKSGSIYSRIVYFSFLGSCLPLFVADLISDVFYIAYIILASIPLVAFFANPRWLFVFTESEKRKFLFILAQLAFCSLIYVQAFFNIRQEGLVPVSFWALLPNALILVFSAIGFLLNFIMYLVYAGTQNFSSLQQKEFDTLIDVQTVANVSANDTSIYRNLGNSLAEFIGAEGYYIQKLEDNKVIDVDFNIPFNKQEKSTINISLSEVDQFSSKHFKYIPKYKLGIKFFSIIQYDIELSNAVLAKIVLFKEEEHGFDTFTADLAFYLVKNHASLIDNFKRIRFALAEERKKQDKETAKLLQERLLPDKISSFKNLDVVAVAQTFEEVGGDYFDFTETEKGNVNIIIADVAGKGTRAAYHASHMKGIFQTVAYGDESIKQMAIESNRAVGACFDKGVFISAVICNWNPETKQFTYYRAGHCPIILWKEKEKKAEYLDDQGLGFGIIRNSLFDQNIEATTLNLEPGDKIILYTDGVTEYSGEISNEEYGYDRLLEFVSNHGQENSQRLIGNLLNNIIDFNKSPNTNEQTYIFEDDITILVLTVK